MRGDLDPTQILRSPRNCHSFKLKVKTSSFLIGLIITLSISLYNIIFVLANCNFYLFHFLKCHISLLWCLRLRDIFTLCCSRNCLVIWLPIYCFIMCSSLRSFSATILHNSEDVTLWFIFKNVSISFCFFTS